MSPLSWKPGPLRSSGGNSAKNPPKEKKGRVRVWNLGLWWGIGCRNRDPLPPGNSHWWPFGSSGQNYHPVVPRTPPFLNTFPYFPLLYYFIFIFLAIFLVFFPNIPSATYFFFVDQCGQIGWISSRAQQLPDWSNLCISKLHCAIPKITEKSHQKAHDHRERLLFYLFFIFILFCTPGQKPKHTILSICWDMASKYSLLNYKKKIHSSILVLIERHNTNDKIALFNILSNSPTDQRFSTDWYRFWLLRNFKAVRTNSNLRQLDENCDQL